MEKRMVFSQKIKNGTNILGITEPLCYAIPLLSILEGNKITLLERDLLFHVHCSLVQTVKTQKQPKCSLADRRIKKTPSIHTVEYYSSIKGKETLLTT